MRGVEAIFDPDRPIRMLMNQIRSRKTPQALLFTGIDGIGRYPAAIRLAMALNCTGSNTVRSGSDDQASVNEKENGHPVPVCEACPACKKIRSGTHPDILHVEPTGGSIKIDQIRSLRHVLSLKPYEARHRVAILEKTPKMTLPAFNALLKILEEPPERTTLILIANKPSDLLPTIISRCQEVRFAPIPEEQIARSLMDRDGVDAMDAHIAAAMANGSYHTAREMVDPEWQRQRDWVLRELTWLIRSAVMNKQKSVRRILAMAEKLANDRQMLDRMLPVMKSWFRDLAVWPFLPDNIINRDMATEIGRLAAVPDTRKTFYHGFAEMEKMEKQVQTNANLRLALETCFFKLTKKWTAEDRSG